MKITTQAWETYIRRLAKLNEKAAQLMAEYLAAHGTADTEALIDYAAALVQKYGEGSAELACHAAGLLTKGRMLEGCSVRSKKTMSGKYHRRI